MNATVTDPVPVPDATTYPAGSVTVTVTGLLVWRPFTFAVDRPTADVFPELTVLVSDADVVELVNVPEMLATVVTAGFGVTRTWAEAALAFPVWSKATSA